MQIEKYCKDCNQHFFYDNGIDEGLSGDKSSIHTIDQVAFCPRCIDPHLVPGQHYKKQTILELFARHLKSKGIVLARLEQDQIVDMMKGFPSTYNLYISNSTYSTVNLDVGTVFQGKNGQFEIGGVIETQRPTTNEHGTFFAYNREIRCLRCKRKTVYSRKDTLQFYLQLKLKQCIHCDVTVTNHKRDTSGLNRNGSEKSEFSDRAMAKALNVSRNDYRRYNITERVEPLPDGTVINGLTIRSSFWDDDPMSYSPKYVLDCPKCKQTFICLQKQVKQQQHFCPVAKQ